MKYCQQCGAELPADASFCAQCGFRVEPQPTQEVEAVMASADVEPALPEPEIEEAEIAEAVPAEEPPAAPRYYEPPPVPQPTYGYGAPPPPQAPYPYQPAHAPQPYAQTPAPYPSYAYGAPPPAPKRKKRWYIPVIIVFVILGLLAVTWFVFGDQIRNLISSPEKKWRQAEAASSLIPEDSMLYAVQATMGDLLGQKKFGSVTELTFDIKSDALPEEAAEILTLLSSLRLQLESRVDTDTDPAQFHTRLGLGRRGEAEEALAAEIYNVGDYYFFSLPGILDKPVAVQSDELDDLLGSQGDLFGLTGQSSKLDTLTGDELDQMVKDLKDIFNKHADTPEIVKGETMTIGGVSQVLDHYQLIVPSDRFPAMAKEILAYLRDHEGLKDLLTGLAEPVPMPGYEYGQNIYDQFLTGLEEAIEDIEDYPEDYAIEARRKLFVDKKNKPVGEELILVNREDGEEETIKLTSLHVEDGERHAQLYSLGMDDELQLEYLASYTMEGGLRTGDFSVKFGEMDWDGSLVQEEILKGSFSDFSLMESGDALYPVGRISITLKDFDDLAMGDLETVTINYDGKIESKAGHDHLIAKVELRVPVDGEPLSITVGIDHHALPGKEISLRNDMPADYYDTSDDEAMAEIMMDESVMERLMEALEKLGIDPEALEGFSGGDDWDDWDDWDTGG